MSRIFADESDDSHPSTGYHLQKNWSVAQWVEQQFGRLWVAGSIPVRRPKRGGPLIARVQKVLSTSRPCASSSDLKEFDSESTRGTRGARKGVNGATTCGAAARPRMLLQAARLWIGGAGHEPCVVRVLGVRVHVSAICSGPCAA